MYYEGDIKPVVKRVRPFKTLLITLPAKSFGFWVLANTKIEACQDIDHSNKTNSNRQTLTERLKVKRSVDDDFEDYNSIVNLVYDYDNTATASIDNKALIQRITDINRDLGRIQKSFQNNRDRFKRDERRTRLWPKNDRNIDLDPKGLLSNILQKAKQSVEVLKNKGFKEVKRRLNKNRVNKRHSKHFRVKTFKRPMRHFSTQRYERISKKIANLRKMPKHVTSMSKKNLGNFNHDLSKHNVKTNQRINEDPKKLTVIDYNFNGKHSLENEITKDIDILQSKNRRRRDIDKDVEELSFENDIDFHEKEERKAKLWKMLKKIQEEMKDLSQEVTDEELSDSPEGIVLKTELSDDSATIKVEDTGKGLLQSTMKNMVNVLEDLNKNFNRFWDVLGVLG